MADDGPALRRRRLGARLRALREARSMTMAQVGRAIERSASWVSRVEAGRMALRIHDLRDILDAFGVTEVAVREELEELASGRHEQGWWSRYRAVIPEPYATLIGLETEATAIRSYENLVFPGLLQTRRYAEAIFRSGLMDWSERDVQGRTDVRIRRQEILRSATPPDFSIIIEESVIDQTVGSREIMLEQLEAVIAATEQPHIELRVVRYLRARPTISAVGFVVLNFAAADPPIAYVENPTGGTILEGEGARIYEKLFLRLSAATTEPRESLGILRRARELLHGPPADGTGR